jgi:hypothetical protein
MPPEGLHLDRRGLRLLTELAQLGREIEVARAGGSDARCARLIARRMLMRREAKSHCRQAGIQWEKFLAALKKKE